MLNVFHVNIASLDKYLDDLHHLLSMIKLQMQVIVIYEYKIKKCSCLNSSLPTYNTKPTTSTPGGVGFLINNNLCCKVRNDL